MATEFVFVAECAVLDFLNTVAIVHGIRKDFLNSDADVCDWMERAGFFVDRGQRLPSGSLLAAAQQLRDLARNLIVGHKAGQPLALDAINDFLARTTSHGQLVATQPDTLALRRTYAKDSAEGALGALAEAVAAFLATANFELVRPCEGEDCILWFYDRTKSHRRRWCSMAVCGNRHKVSAFRARQSG